LLELKLVSAGSNSGVSGVAQVGNRVQLTMQKLKHSTTSVKVFKWQIVLVSILISKTQQVKHVILYSSVQ